MVPVSPISQLRLQSLPSTGEKSLLFKTLIRFNGFEDTSWRVSGLQDHEYVHGKFLSLTPDSFCVINVQR